MLVKSRLLVAITVPFAFLLYAAASVHAQDAPSSFLNWLHQTTRTDARHRPEPLPPLPRARPAESGPAAVARNKPATLTPDIESARIPD